MKYTHIVWDFNGTLLDDLHPCIDVLNTMLTRRNLEQCTESRYKEVFGFPIKSYYEKLGFDFTKEDYAVLAEEWAELYVAASRNCGLCDGVLPALDFFQSEGISQIILSATEINMLEKQLKPLGIRGYFDEVLALSNLFAFSKVDLGKAWVKRVKPEKALFIGDTIHDYETARAMGTDCALVAGGHQSRSRLETTGAAVYDNLRSLVESLH